VGDPDRDHGRLWEPSRDNRRRAHHRDLPDGHRHRLRRRADRRRSRALRPQSEGGGGTRASRAPRDPWDAWTTSPPGSMRSNGDNPGPHRAARWRGPWAGWATRPFPEMLRAVRLRDRSRQPSAVRPTWRRERETETPREPQTIRFARADGVALPFRYWHACRAPGVWKYGFPIAPHTMESLPVSGPLKCHIRPPRAREPPPRNVGAGEVDSHSVGSWTMLHLCALA
jgi:hypothetical protein